jgi:hypothetical protein
MQITTEQFDKGRFIKKIALNSLPKQVSNIKNLKLAQNQYHFIC